MKILVIEPEKAPYEKEIGDDIHDMQAIVGGCIEPIYFEPKETAIAWCNDEFLLNGSQPNRIVGNVLVHGTFFVSGNYMNEYGEWRWRILRLFARSLRKRKNLKLRCHKRKDQVMQMKITATINRFVDKQDSSVKAYASVTMDGMFAVHGLKVMETEKGRFVNMPSTSYTDRDGNKQYSDIFHAITKAARNALNQAVLNAYDVKLQQIQATEIEVENTPDEEMSDEPADEPEPEIAM